MKNQEIEFRASMNEDQFLSAEITPNSPRSRSLTGQQWNKSGDDNIQNDEVKLRL